MNSESIKTNTTMVKPVDPHTVMSPKGAISNLRVIHDGRTFEEGDPLAGWSCATFEWYGNPTTGLRWDGGEGQPSGMPQARGIPIWFVVPDPLAEIVAKTVNELRNGGNDTTKSLRRCVNDLIYTARRASPEELARLQLSL
jgi:hypothetical protein